MLNIHEVIKVIKGAGPEKLLTPELLWKSLQGAFITLRDVPPEFLKYSNLAR